MRLIDADALKKDVGKLWEQMDDVDFGELVRDFWKVLNHYPTIDAVPVVHAKWVDQCYGYRNCSKCGCEHPLRDAKGFLVDDDYCPNCGAKMDEPSPKM